MRRAELAPLVGRRAPVVGRAGRDADPLLDTECRPVSPCLLGPGPHLRERLRPAAVERALREEAVREPAARRSARSAEAPIQIGIGRCTGSGLIPAAVIVCQRPS